MHAGATSGILRVGAGAERVEQALAQRPIPQ
jgi:hypothetical protein